MAHPHEPDPACPDHAARYAPLEYIAAAAQAGYAGLALRVHASPGLPFSSILGNEPLIRDIRRALDDAPPVWEIGSFYLKPDTELSAFKGALALGAEFGAKFAFVIGDDPDAARLCDRFAGFCGPSSDTRPDRPRRLPSRLIVGGRTYGCGEQNWNASSLSSTPRPGLSGSSR